jgi:RHS repeat-associated protein
LVLTSVLNNFVSYSGVYLVGSFVSQTTPSLSATVMKHTVNMKVYELNNHLGNVLVTVSDARQTLNTSTAVTGFAAIVKSATDYSAFGAPMAGRTYTSVSYRYGFNNKAKDDEITGSSGIDYDFGARIYDTRLGRWMSIDPFSMKYPGFSHYIMVNDCPIRAIDPDGRLIIFSNGEVATNSSQRANVSYWGQAFVDKTKAHFGDNNVKFVDGDQGGNPIERYNAGYNQGKAAAVDIIKNLQRDENGNIVESVNMISHSKGSEYGDGYIDAIREEMEKEKADGTIKYAPGVEPIGLVIHNAPHQSDAIYVKPSTTTTISVSHEGDPLSDDDARGDILNIMTKKADRTSPLAAHSVDGFLYEDLRLTDAYKEKQVNGYDLKYAGYADALNDVQNAQVGPNHNN